MHCVTPGKKIFFVPNVFKLQILYTKLQRLQYNKIGWFSWHTWHHTLETATVCFSILTGNKAKEADEVSTSCSCESPISYHPFLTANQWPRRTLPPSRATAQETSGVEDVHVKSPGMHWINPTLQVVKCQPPFKTVKSDTLQIYIWGWLEWQSESYAETRKWPFALWSFKFLICRRDVIKSAWKDEKDFALYCLIRYISWWFSSVLPITYFLKECHL